MSGLNGVDTPGFPGGTAVTGLRVYDWQSADGLCGGSPHLHTVSSEAYVVTGGTGQVHGLPEAGDAVLTFPRRILADPDKYALQAVLPHGLDQAAMEMAARARRDLALEGYAELHMSVLRDGPEAPAHFHRAAAALVRPRVGRWRQIWEETVRKQADATARALDQLVEGSAASMAQAAVASALPRPGEGYGMCGRLTTWEDSRVV